MHSPSHQRAHTACPTHMHMRTPIMRHCTRTALAQHAGPCADMHAQHARRHAGKYVLRALAHSCRTRDTTYYVRRHLGTFRYRPNKQFVAFISPYARRTPCFFCCALTLFLVTREPCHAISPRANFARQARIYLFYLFHLFHLFSALKVFLK